MAYTVLKLITNAFNITGIVSKEFETVSGSQFQDGLDMLNDILGEKTIDNGMIPYVTKDTFQGVIGQELYFIPDLIDIDTLTFDQDNVRYGVWPLSRKAYFGSSRANDITSLPYNYRLERTFGGANIYTYFLPDENYVFEYVGTKRLASVTLNQDLELTLDRFYISYLKYQLVQRACSEYRFTMPPESAKILQGMIDTINNASAPIDTSMRKLSTLGGDTFLNYAQFNLGNGWTT